MRQRNPKRKRPNGAATVQSNATFVLNECMICPLGVFDVDPFFFTLLKFTKKTEFLGCASEAHLCLSNFSLCEGKTKGIERKGFLKNKMGDWGVGVLEVGLVLKATWLNRTKTKKCKG